MIWREKEGGREGVREGGREGEEGDKPTYTMMRMI